MSSRSDGTPTTGMHGERFGRFVLLRPIHEGGMGALTLAWDSEARRLVALKRPAHADAAARTRFADEVELSRRLSHRNLGRSLADGEIDGAPWLALEWIAGQDLGAVVARAQRYDKPLGITRAAGIAQQLLEALEHAHAVAGFVHRDVAPGNVMIGYDGVVRLVDYGLAQWELKNARTLPGTAPGTAGFMAPEQRAGQPADARADLFAVAALLQYMWTGLPTFGGEDFNSKEALRLRLAEHGVALPPLLLTFLWRGLQTNPANRYASATEMRQTLAAAHDAPAAGEAVLAELMAGLFPVEKRASGDEAAAWTHEPTFVVPGRRALVILATASVATIAASALWLLAAPTPNATTAVSAAASTAAPARSPGAAPAPAARMGGSHPATSANLPAPASTAVATEIAVEAATQAPAGTSGVRAPSVASALPAPAPTQAPAGTSAVRAPSVASALPAPAPTQAGTGGVRAPSTGPTLPALSPAGAASPSASSQKLDHARALVRAGQAEAARTVYQDLLADARARPKAQVALAELAWKAGRYDEAIARATAAAAAGVGAPAYFVRGLAELRAHQPDAAARDFARVLAVEPDNEDARAGLARAQALQRGTAE